MLVWSNFIKIKILFTKTKPKNEVLFTSSSKDKGLIYSFFFEKWKANFTKIRGPSFQLDINTNVSPKKNNLMQFVNKSFSFFVQDDNFTAESDRKNKDLTGFVSQDAIMHKILVTSLYNLKIFYRFNLSFLDTTKPI